ncbi:MAG: carboxypeptidase regulatory-like domain-containing protein, partial [Candidatus Omnitrophota bacterium]
LISLLLMTMHTLAQAEELTVFGPEEFIRVKGAPQTITRDFTVSNPAGEFILRVYSERRIKHWCPKKGPFHKWHMRFCFWKKCIFNYSAIYINGNRVLRPRDFIKSAEFIEIPVTLKANNTIKVRLIGMPGNAITVSIVNINVDNVLPVIDIVEPGDGSIISDDTPFVNITYSDAHSGVDITTLEILMDGIDCAGDFNISSGAATYQLPPASALADGSHSIQASISDMAGNNAVTNITFEVDTYVPPPPPPDPPITTPESGFIHGYVYNARTEAPLEGAQIEVKDIAGVVLTNADGKFTFPTPGTGTFYLTITKPGFTYAQRQASVITTRDVAVDAVYLTPEDSQVTTITPQGGTASNAAGTIELIFPQGAVSSDIDVTATQYQASRELPGTLPEQSFFTYAVDFTPDGATFDQPVILRVFNHLGFAPGTPIPMGYYNKEIFMWQAEGMGVITPDGNWAEFEITHFSPYDLNCASVASGKAGAADMGKQESQEQVNPDAAKDPGEARILVKDGSVSIDYTLPSVRSLGRATALTLTYNSSTVNSNLLIGTSAIFNPGLLLKPETTTFDVNFAGEIHKVTFQGEEWDTHQRILLDTKNARGEMLETGNYQYSIKLSNEYQTEYATAEYFGGPPVAGTGVFAPELESLTTPISARVVVNNQTESAFGAGWSLDGLQRIHSNPDGTLLLTEGDGTALTFTPEFYAHSILPNNQKDPESPYEIRMGSATESLTFDAQGNLYAVERAYSPKVIKVTPDGTITTFASGFNSPRGIAFDSLGNAYVSDLTGPIGTIYKITPLGVQSVFYSSSPANYWDLVFDKDDNLYIADAPAFNKSKIIKVTPDGQGSTYVIIDGFLYGLCFDDKGNLYGSEMISGILDLGGGVISMSGANRVFKVTPDKAVSTYATGFTMARGIAFNNTDGNLYVADTWLHKIFRVTPEHMVEPVVLGDTFGSSIPTFTGSIGFFEPKDLSFDNSGNLFCTNRFFLRYPYASLFNTVSFLKPSNSYIPPAGEYTRLTKNADNTFTRATKDGVKINFNEEGLHTNIIDRNGNTTSFNYDVESRLISITNPVGQTTSFNYDTSGYLNRATDSTGRETLFQVDTNGDLVNITAPDGNITQYGYDEKHLITSQTTPRGYTTDYTYDTSGRIKDEIYSEAEVLEGGLPVRKREKTSFQPSDSLGIVNNLEAGVGTPENPAPVVRYDDIRYTVTHGTSVTTGLTDKSGILIEETDALGNTTKIERDDNNNPLKILKPNDLETEFTYDANGNITNIYNRYVPEGVSAIFLSSTNLFYEPNFNQLKEKLS